MAANGTANDKDKGEGDSEATEKADDSLPAQSTAAVKQIRETAKWLVTVFGAVAAAMIGSLSLADVGELDDASRWWAIAGFGLAMAGMLLVIVGVARVLSPTETTLDELAADEQSRHLQGYLNDRTLLAQGFANVDEVRRYYTNALEERIRGYRRLLDRDVHESATSDGATLSPEEATQEYTFANSKLELVNPIVTQLLATVSFEKVRRRFTQAIWGAVVPGVVIAAVGAAIFASQITEPEKDADDAVSQRPSRVVMAFADDAAAQYQPLLGTSCGLGEVEAVVLATDDDNLTVVVTDPECATATFDIDRDDAQVIAIEPTCPLTESPSETSVVIDGFRLPLRSTATATTTPSTSVPPVTPPPVGGGGAPPNIIC